MALESAFVTSHLVMLNLALESPFVTSCLVMQYVCNRLEITLIRFPRIRKIYGNERAAEEMTRDKFYVDMSIAEQVRILILLTQPKETFPAFHG